MRGEMRQAVIIVGMKTEFSLKETARLSHSKETVKPYVNKYFCLGFPGQLSSHLLLITIKMESNDFYSLALPFVFVRFCITLLLLLLYREKPLSVLYMGRHRIMLQFRQ